MNAHVTQLVQEIQELTLQYRREVPGGRRAWPKSIQSRVLRLNTAGVSPPDIARRTGISYFTLINWIPQMQRRRYREKAAKNSQVSAGFVPLAVHDGNEIATVTVESREQAALSAERGAVATSIATVTVTIAGGIRIEGVTVEFLRAWIGQAGVGA